MTLLLAVAIAPVRGQDETFVEEPDWDQSSEAITLEEDLRQPSSDAPAPPVTDDSEAAEPCPTAPPIEEAIDASGTESPADFSEAMESTLGVPSEQNWYLPDFANPADPFFQWEGMRIRIGEVHIRLSLDLAFRYDDNIFQSNTDVVADYVTEITPTVLVGAGDYTDKNENYFSLAYSPQLQLFAVTTSSNTVNESLAISGQYAFSRLTTSADLGYSRNSDPTSEQVGRVENNFFSFAWNNSYALGAKTFLEGSLGMSYIDYGQRIDYTTLSASGFLAYAYSPKLRLSAGPFAGITYVEDGGEQPFQGVNVGIAYDTLHKLSFNALIGVQARQFRGPNPADQSDFITPTFGLGATYAISALSGVTLNLSRAVGNSGLFQGQTVITNTVGLQLRHQLERVVLSLRLQYQILDYEGSGANDRSDYYVEAQPSVGYQFWQGRCEVSLFYIRRQRTSDDTFRDFQENAFGTRINVDF